MDLYLTKRDLYSKVADIRKKLNIKEDEYPVKIQSKCLSIKNLELQYHDFNSCKLGGILMHGNKVDTMILNSKRTNEEKEFDCAHEVIHLFEHRGNGTLFNCFDKNYVRDLNKIDTTIEWQANEGAAELLLPWKNFIPNVVYEYMSTEGDFDKSSIVNYILAINYGVTEAIIEYRIENLKYEILQFLNGISLYEIEILSNNQIKKSGIVTNGYLDRLNNLA